MGSRIRLQSVGHKLLTHDVLARILIKAICRNLEMTSHDQPLDHKLNIFVIAMETI